MSLRAVQALLCLVLPLVMAVSMTGPTSTHTSIHSTRLPPPWSQTTPPPSMTLRRREYTTSSHGLGGIYGSSTCGWPEGNASAVPDGCPSGTCVYHPSDTKYPDMVACCTSGTSCGFFTTCVPGTELVKTPAILETQGAFTLPCGFDDIPECVTHYYPQVNASNYLCGKTAAEYTFFTTGRLTTTSSTVNILSLSLSTVDMDFVNSFSSTEYFTDDNLPTSSTVLDPTNLPSSDSHTTNKGAIAGGVVGGVAGVALLAGAGFFLLKRRRSKQGPSGGGDDANNSGAAGEHKDKNIAEAGTKGPKELDSVEAARLAEMQGTTPVGEMQGSDVREMPREMQGSDVREMAREMPDTQVKKDFAVELPADPEYSDKR